MIFSQKREKKRTDCEQIKEQTTTTTTIVIIIIAKLRMITTKLKRVANIDPSLIDLLRFPERTLPLKL